MNDKIKCWAEIAHSFEDVRNMPTRPSGKKLPIDHIINPNQTVEWNRLRVAQYNSMYDKKVKELKEIKVESEKALYNSIVDKIAYELSITNSRAKIIWDYIFKDHYKERPEEIIDAVEELVDTLYNAFRC